MRAPALKDTLVSFKEVCENVFHIAIEGHPTQCLDGAHKLRSTHFRDAWQFTKIEAESPEQRGRQFDWQWLFHIRAELRYPVS